MLNINQHLAPLGYELVQYTVIQDEAIQVEVRFALTGATKTYWAAVRPLERHVVKHWLLEQSEPTNLVELFLSTLPTVHSVFELEVRFSIFLEAWQVQQ